jgi:hypothetical protein
MKRNFPAWFVFLVALAIGIPAFPAQSEDMIVEMCGGGTQTIAIAPDPAAPFRQDKRDACKKACHAASDRRKRLG